MTAVSEPGAERAVVTYPAPHGVEALVLCDGDVARFGRGSDCEVRFGYAPRPDQGLPRIAGRLVAAHGRVYVESSGQAGHRALVIRSSAGTTASLAVGEALSPREARFEVLVHGDGAAWALAITVRPPDINRSGGSSVDPPTKRYNLALTPLQWKVLDAYSQPIMRGGLEPATHRQVAAALNYHPNTVREALYEIWTAMFAEQVPMPDVSDKRFAVVQAARIHGLLAG